jgi:hypothetical protein
VVIDVVRLKNGAGELLEQVGLFVGDAVRTNYTDALAAARVATLAKFLSYIVERNFPADRLQLTIRLADERLRNASLVVGKVKGVAALVAEEVAVDAGLVAVVAANDLAAVGHGAYAKRSLAAVAAVRADRSDVIHLPWAGLISVSTGRKRAHRAGVDAHAALLAVNVGKVIG